MKIRSILRYFSALPVFAMLAPAACGGDTGDTGGGGTTTTTTSTSTAPAESDGAFFLTLVQDNPLTCNVAGHSAQVGDVTAAEKKTVVTDGKNQTRVACSIDGSGPFEVHGKIDDTLNSGNYLEIFIPEISPGASAASPAIGSLVFQSPKTASTYVGNACTFYFETTPQTVTEGRVWVTFACAGISSTTSTCPVPVGYAIFENCIASAP